MQLLAPCCAEAVLPCPAGCRLLCCAVLSRLPPHELYRLAAGEDTAAGLYHVLQRESADPATTEAGKGSAPSQTAPYKLKAFVLIAVSRAHAWACHASKHLVSSNTESILQQPWRGSTAGLCACSSHLQLCCSTVGWCPAVPGVGIT